MKQDNYTRYPIDHMFGYYDYWPTIESNDALQLERMILEDIIYHRVY